eukprot:TRINITY_DN9689_c0_g1_i1.p1 TRINITY_DN9689_c0_g1~~TRINITY_DN9689_c0_g1_i1.p1  ORF type:complete len:384 (+),score=137.61 TRINITY_DN9689_c0_g1_i1:74-1225(+)
MNKYIRGLLVFFALLMVVNCKWETVGKKIGLFIPGIDFIDENNGFLAGFSFKHGSEILKTTNGGLNFTEMNVEHRDSLVFYSLDMYNSTYGIAGGIGIPLFPGIATISDGSNWIRPNTPLFYYSTFLDSQADSSTLMTFGSWDDAFNNKLSGMQVIHQGEKEFQTKDWQQILNARYGSFINGTYGFIAGGSETDLLPTPISSTEFRLTPNHVLVKNEGLVYRPDNSLKDQTGEIARTIDGGNDWKNVFNTTNTSFKGYFNGISFVDENNGWVVGISESDTMASYIFNTNDGGNTWNQQFYEEKVHFFRVRFIDENNGWAVGFKFPDITIFSAACYRTTDGGKRWDKYDINDVIAYDISIVDSDTAYLTGFGLDFSSNLYKYTS